MKPPPWKTWAKLAVLLFIGIAMYALAGLLLGPRGVESHLRAMVEQHPGLTLEVAAASVNPFTLGFSAANVIIIGPENTPLVSIPRLEGHVHPASAIEAKWILWRVTVHEPHSELHVGRDDFAAVSRLFAAILRSTTDHSGPRSGRIAHLAVRRGEVRLGDIRIAGTPAPPFVLHDLELEVLGGGAASPGKSSFELTAAASHRARIAAAGEVTIASEMPGAELSFSVDDASVFNPYLSLARGWTSSAGEVHGKAMVEFDETGFRVSGDAELQELAVTGPNGVTFELLEIGGTFRRPGRSGDVAAASLRGRLADGGAGEVTAEWLPEAPRDFTRVEAQLQDISLAAISPYAGQAIGRPAPGGTLDLTLILAAEGGQLGLDNRLAIRNLELGEAPSRRPTTQLPLDLAVALLEDDQRHIAINLHVPARPVRPGLEPTIFLTHALTNALADFVTDITANPFEHLAALAGQPGIDLGRMAFPAGSPEVTEGTAAKLAVLGTLLEARPRLGLVVYPGYDPVSDREALARQQVELHIRLATSSGAPGQPDEEPIDFADRKVHSVLDEFAENRLPVSRQEAIGSRHAEKGIAYYRDVFEVLVDNEDVSPTALNRLARYRARAIVHGVAASHENSARIRQADVIKTVEPGDAPGVVELEVEPAPVTAEVEEDPASLFPAGASTTFSVDRLLTLPRRPSVDEPAGEIRTAPGPEIEPGNETVSRVRAEVRPIPSRS